MLVQVAYAIGVAQPVSIFVNTYGTARKGLSDGEIAAKIQTLFDLRPAAIIERFSLRNPIYEPTANYGHFGRKPYTRRMRLLRGGKSVEKTVGFFLWEKLDEIDRIKQAFGI